MFFCLENIAIFLSASDTELAYFFRFDITKQHRNNETDTKSEHFYIYVYVLYLL